MKEIRMMMGMPITVEILDPQTTEAAFTKVFDYFGAIDERFSTYKKTSEISLINHGTLKEKDWSADMKLIFALSEKTKQESKGYFDIKTPLGHFDPSGIVKGWAIHNAAGILKKDGFKNYFIDAGGDIETSGVNVEGKKWAIGIKNPWNEAENVKVVYVGDAGVATSGIYIRGLHIYNPNKKNRSVDEVMSLTVVGPDIYEADRFATAAFAMGKDGIAFIESLEGFEGYAIDKDKVATMTSGFEKYTEPDA